MRNAILVFLAGLIFSSCSVFTGVDREAQDFVRVQGTQLFLNGAPYYFAGANMWYGCYLGSPGLTGDRPRLLRELDSLAARGITNLRVLAASEESYTKKAVSPAIQKEPGRYDDSLLIGLDFLLAEMAKRRMCAVLFLNNYWEWSGGMAQYVSWAAGGLEWDPENPSVGWKGFMRISARFYSMPAAVQLNRDFIRMIVGRTNSINGRKYTEDPTVMSWQLANEPRPGPDDETGVANLPAFYRWIDETAQYIKSLDTNHLVSAGSEGTVGTLQSAEYFRAAYSFPSIDYLNLHVWPLNWGWFDPTRIAETYPSTVEKVKAYIALHLRLARELNKPITMEEFGLGRDLGDFRPGTPTTARDAYFTTVYSMIYDSAKAGAPIAGSNVWAWGGEGAARHPDGAWRKGDSFMGDPPQEPQGRNSLLLSDTTTLGILTDHARKMSALCPISANDDARR